MSTDPTPGILNRVASYYSSKLAEHGATPLGVDSNGQASHELRHGQFLRLLRGAPEASVIDLGFGGAPLVEAHNDSLTGALVEREMLSGHDAVERLAVQNVGDFERVLRTLAGAALVIASRTVHRSARGPFTVAGAIIGLSGLTGWCPVYQDAGVTSLDGPGDRPEETTRDAWLIPRASLSASHESAAGAPAGAIGAARKAAQ